MKTYVFSGKVHPERANVNISPIKFEFGESDPNFKGKATIAISWSQISLILNIESNVDLPTMKNTMEHMIRFIVDSYGYISGRGYDVELTSVVDPNNNQTVFGVGIDDLEAIQNQRPLPFSDIVKLAFQSKQLQHALNNLRESIRSPWDTGFFCYRAIECIRQDFKQADDKDEKASWDNLNKNLRIEKTYAEQLRKYALPQRHGDMPEMTGVEQVALMKCAWSVVDR